jgi:RNA polymerase sigma factor (sigma-70 family)
MTTDAEAIAASLEQGQAFILLFDRHFEVIQRYLRRRLPGVIADDLAAETFTVAFDRRDSYDLSRSDARPWLFGIATNLLRGHRRRELRELHANARADAADVAAPEVDPDARLDAKAAGPLLAQALASLEARDRDALLLFAWTELGYEEIAAALEVPVGTVRSRLHRARRLVRAQLVALGMLDPTLEEVS